MTNPNSDDNLTPAGAGAGLDDLLSSGDDGLASGSSVFTPVSFAQVFPTAPIISDAAPSASYGSVVGGTFGQNQSPYTTVTVKTGDVTFNLEFTKADNPTANFETDVENAAKILSSAIYENITLNIVVGYGEEGGTTLTGGSAEGGPSSGNFFSYSTVRADLLANKSPGDTNFSALPTGTTIGGQSSVIVWNAEQKALGLMSATATGDDGIVGFATDIPDSEMVGVALHEITHSMGRAPDSTPDIFEFTRFSAPGAYVFDDNIPGPASYFSVDGGNTTLAVYGQDSDPSDFANPNVGTPQSNLSPNDPFNQYYSSSTTQTLTSLDLTQLDVLGFDTSPPCFARGTGIRTESGDVPVESLRVGDVVVTESGQKRPISWIGHRGVDCANHPDPLAVLPVRILAGAIARGRPARDLVVSPDHSLYLDGVLARAHKLVNGSTIRRERPASVEYWHVELDTHDILVAEGQPAESYLDCGNRSAFAEHEGPIDMHPRFAPAPEAEHLWRERACAPRGDEVEAIGKIWAALQVRARELGAATTADPGLRLVADGEMLTPVAVENRRFRFDIPEGVVTLRLLSRADVPADLAELENPDRRRLGVRVSGLEVDGATVDAGHPAFLSGWNEVEIERDFASRWTNGDAALPLGRRIEFQIDTLPKYTLPLRRVEAAGAVRAAAGSI